MNASSVQTNARESYNALGLDPSIHPKFLEQLVAEIEPLEINKRLYSQSERISLEEGLSGIIDRHIKTLAGLDRRARSILSRANSSSVIGMMEARILSAQLITAIQQNVDFIKAKGFDDVTKILEENGKMARALVLREKFGNRTVFELVFVKIFYDHTDRYRNLSFPPDSAESRIEPSSFQNHGNRHAADAQMVSPASPDRTNFAHFNSAFKRPQPE